MYFVLTNCHGQADLAVEFVDPADRVLSRGEYRFEVDDPLAVAVGMGGIDGAPIDRPGTYRLRLSCGGHVLAERPIIVGPG